MSNLTEEFHPIVRSLGLAKPFYESVIRHNVWDATFASQAFSSPRLTDSLCKDLFLVTRSDQNLVQKVTTSVATWFSIKDMGNLTYFLGFKANMLNAKPILAPLATHPKLTLHTRSFI